MTKGQAKLGGQHLYGLVSPQLNSWTCCASLQSFALLNPDFLGFSFKLGLPGLNSKLSALRMVQGMCRWFLQPSVCDPMNFKCPTNIQTVCFLVASPLVAYLKPLVAFPQWLLATGTCRGCHRCASLPSMPVLCKSCPCSSALLAFVLFPAFIPHDGHMGQKNYRFAWLRWVSSCLGGKPKQHDKTKDELGFAGNLPWLHMTGENPC